MRARTTTESGGLRTWGPFTGRQLTTVICIGIVTVLFPVTAFALSGSPVFLQDPHSRQSATVDASGNVQTRVNGGAPGNVAATSQFAQSNELVLTSTFVPLLTPGGKELIVTDVHLDWFGVPVPAGDPFVLLEVGEQETCTNVAVATSQVFDLPTAQGFDQVKFSPGYIVPAGKSLCARVETTAGTAIVNAFGYYVAAGSVASPNAQTGRPVDPRVRG